MYKQLWTICLMTWVCPIWQDNMADEKDDLKELKAQYNITFASKEGETVLADLKSAYYHRSSFSNDPYEIYAICTKLYGGGNVGVFCQDGKDRLCILRKKFKGRGKRDNTVSIGIYLLVGIREFENRNTNKLG